MGNRNWRWFYGLPGHKRYALRRQDKANKRKRNKIARRSRARNNK